MRGFILKLKKLEERQTKKTLTLRKLYKMVQATIDFHRYSAWSRHRQKRSRPYWGPLQKR